jgi:predicted enzyme related to lactoylglutathione lyase
MKKIIFCLSVFVCLTACMTEQEKADSEKFVINQFAMTVADIDASMKFYQDIFGFKFAGKQKLSGSLAASVQGLDEVEAEYGWLVDDSEFFQFEFFEYAKPVAAENYGKSDFEFCMIAVSDISVVFNRLDDMSISYVDESFENLITSIKLCTFNDPDGIEVRVIEDIEADNFQAKFWGTSILVSDVVAASEFFEDLMVWGHTAEFDAVVEHNSSGWEVYLQDSAGHILYVSQSEDLQQHNIYEPGISHLCFGSRSRSSFRALDSHLREQGCKANSKAMDALFGGSVYFKPFDGASAVVEIMYLQEWADGTAGFKAFE